MTSTSKAYILGSLPSNKWCQMKEGRHQPTPAVAAKDNLKQAETKDYTLQNKKDKIIEYLL